jgi:hypothetical protein
MARNGRASAIRMVHSVRHRARGELSADAITAFSRYDHNARAIDQDRRRFAGAAAMVVAAAGTLSLLTVAATEGDAIRPSTSPFCRSDWWTSAGAGATRWLGKETVADKPLGVQLATVEQLGRYRRAGYD